MNAYMWFFNLEIRVNIKIFSIYGLYEDSKEKYIIRLLI